MNRLRPIATAMTATAALSVAVSAHGTPYFQLCFTVEGEYHSLVERRMREALPDALAPLLIRYSTPIFYETGIGIARRADGFHLVRLQFDRSLYYESWVELEEVPEDFDPAQADSVVEVVFRADGGPLGVEFQDFSRVNPRVAIVSIPISDGLANEFVALLDSFGPAGESEAPTALIIDGVSMELFQTGGRCLWFQSDVRDSAASITGGLFGLLERSMSEWRPFRRDEFEAEVLAKIGEVREAQ